MLREVFFGKRRHLARPSLYLCIPLFNFIEVGVDVYVTISFCAVLVSLPATYDMIVRDGHMRLAFSGFEL